MINVLLSQSKGVAVFNDGPELQMVTIRRPTEILALDERSAARLMADASDLEALSVCDKDALRKHLAIRSEREELLNAALIMLDGTRSKGLRRKAAIFVSSRPRSDQWIWVENVLLSTPAPESADAQGAAGLTQGLGNFFGELSRAQQRVSLVRTAWHALPDTVFGQDSRAQANARVVGKGVFRALVTGSAGNQRSPFSPAIETYARWLSGRESGDQKSHSPMVVLRAHKDFSGAGTSNTWDIAPWRSAWLATEWAEIEAKLACDSVTEWQAIVPALTRNRGRISEVQDQLSKLFDGWDYVRHRSPVSATVDFIHQLVHQPEQQDFRKVLFEQLKSTVEQQYLTPNPVLPKQVRNSLDAAARVGESELFNVVQTFFDAEKWEASEIMGKHLFSHKRNFEIDANIARRRAVAYCVQFSGNSLTPVHCNHDELDNLKIGSYSHHGASLVIWESVIKLALSTFSLDQRFQRGGFAVLIQEFAQKSKSSPQNRRAVLMNFNNRKSYFLVGKIATVIQRLQRRLVADLSSGLPVERSGWLPTGDIAKRIGVSNQSLIRRITDFERELIASGFDPNSVQVEAQNVRLNPNVVATSSMMGAHARENLTDSAPKPQRTKPN